ncbi:hypothetical protein OAA03_00300 [bacterium]|nr:hypothetical protein [bacterium]
MLEDTDKIGISMSGGLDSSLMTWLLCKEISDNNKNTEVFPLHGIDNTRPTSPENIQNIINFLRTSFPSVKIHDMLTWDNTKDYIIPKSEKDTAGLKKYMYSHNIRYIYQGRTANPPKEVTDNFGGHFEKVRSHNNDKPTIVHSVKNNSYLIRPWINVDKKYIYEQYKKHNLLDTLEPLTWSCIAFMYETKFFTEPCKTCYWCKEKHWGFGKY